MKMNKLIRSTFSLLAVAISVAAFPVSADTIDLNDWKLTHAYEFDKLKLDEWNTQYIWPRETIINNEQQWYLDPLEGDVSPFAIEDGVLEITADTTTGAQVRETNGQPYTSGLLTSRHKGYSQLYGYFEARAKLPSAQGSWPAIWFLPTFDQWPSGIAVLSELDLMEAVADVHDGVYHTSAHTNETGKLTSKSNKIKTGEDLTGEFHRYGVEWDAEKVVWYFNGSEVFRIDTPADWHEPRHLLINYAVGGWGGSVVSSDYPDVFAIDYVRFYEKRSGGDPVSVVVTPTPTENDPVVTTTSSGRVIDRATLQSIIDILEALK